MKPVKILDLVENYLKVEPRARERKNRAIAVWNLTIKKLNLSEDTLISKKDFTETKFWKTASTVNRSILRVQQLNPELRGTDYKDKEVLEEEAQLEQGYTPGLSADLKKLKTL